MDARTGTNRYEASRLDDDRMDDMYGDRMHGDRMHDDRMHDRDDQRMLQRRDRSSSGSSGGGVMTVLGLGMIGAGALMVVQGLRQGSERSSTATRRASSAIRVRERVTIAKPAQELFDFWRDLENLPKVMRHLKSVEHDSDTGLTHWVAEAPLGARVSWDAEIRDENPGEMISWRSLPDSQVATEGTVQFRRVSDDQTDLIVSMSYHPPGGRAGNAIAHWFGRDGQQEIHEDLHRFKEEVEAGRLSLR